MKGKKYAFLFLFIFTAFLAAPSLISIIQPDTDTSVFFNVAEEENKGSNSITGKECVFSHHNFSNYFLSDNKKDNATFGYVDNHYPSITLNKHCPPPEPGV